MKSIYLIALALFFVFGCQSESPNSSSNRVNDPNFPTTGNDGDNSITDIPTPSYSSHTVAAGTVSGYKVCLSWNSNTPGYATGYSSYSTTPTDANNYDHDAEYWGNTQNSIVGPGSDENHPNQPYSGHYEIYRDGVKIADVTGSSYCDDNLAGGTYTYTIKSKSLEGVQPNAMTHHSEMSAGYEVTTNCEATILVTGTGTVNVGNMSLNTNSNKNAANFPLSFKLYCNGTLVTDGTVVDIQLDGVAQTLGYSFDSSTDTYHVNLQNPDQGAVDTYDLNFYIDGDLVSPWTFIVD